MRALHLRRRGIASRQVNGLILGRPPAQIWEDRSGCRMSAKGPNATASVRTENRSMSASLRMRPTAVSSRNVAKGQQATSDIHPVQGRARLMPVAAAHDLRWHQSPAFGRIALASGSSTTRLTTNATTGITWVAGSSKLSRATTKAAGMLRHPAPSAKTFRVGLSAAPMHPSRGDEREQV